MATSSRHIGSELKVLQEAVASAVHELSQPLNVLNLLADNVLDDVASLEQSPGVDAELASDLRRRMESIVEQAAKASDITRWVRAFAVGIGGEPTDFDPDAVIERVAGIFTNDLRVAGVELAVAPAPGTRWACTDEALFAFALTEAVLWLTRTLPEPAEGTREDGTPARRIRIGCTDIAQPPSVAVTIRGGRAVHEAGSPANIGSAGGRAGKSLPAVLPLLGLLGRAAGVSAVMTGLAEGGIHIRIVIPASELLADGAQGGLR
jgi:hypothetical protein